MILGERTLLGQFSEIYPSPRRKPTARARRTPEGKWRRKRTTTAKRQATKKTGPRCSERSEKKERASLPKFNSSPLKRYLPNRKVVFQPSFFSGYVKLRGGVARDFSEMWGTGSRIWSSKLTNSFYLVPKA